MAQYIDKSALAAEIERRIKVSQDYAECNLTESTRIGNQAQLLELNDILSFLNTLEVKDANEALRTEYEKGRADVIAKTLEWINVFNDNNYIMQYSDSCEHPINEIIEWYKNYINRE